MPYVVASMRIASDQASLEAALEGLTALNVRIMRSWQAQGRPIPKLTTAPVRWRPDRTPGGRTAERWDSFDIVLRRGFGDCEDLAAWCAAALRMRGIDARAVVRKSNSPGVAWHAIVQLPDGRILDPSRWCGMGNGRPPVLGATRSAGVNLAQLENALDRLYAKADQFTRRLETAVDRLTRRMQGAP